MRKKCLALACAIAGVVLPIGSAQALRVAAPPGPVRIVNSDVVFVGRVIELEPLDVDAKPYPASKVTVKYRIGLVKVSQVIRGLKNEKTVRVGFIPVVAPKPGEPRISGRRGGPQLVAGQEGLFMLSKHAEGKFYLAPDYGYFVSSQDRNLDNEIKTAKKVVAILADTKSALQSKDADDRLLGASIVIAKYRTQQAPFPNKEEPISAEESKLILRAISEAKWGPFMFGQAHPQQLFFQLGVGPNDGWKAPAKINGPDDLRNAVHAWIREHGEYRIKRFVPAGERP